MIIFDQTRVDKVMKFLGPGLLGLKSWRFTPWNEKQSSHWMHVTESWNCKVQNTMSINTGPIQY